ncbi:MAG: ankyrin repeat domain-containing protein [Anaerolineaceae bacterium]|nr:ankyrin repeat domain-containing protein [Anaerolineaceae bacterium]
MTEIPKEFFQALDHGSLEKVQDILMKNPRLPDMLTDQGISTVLLAAYNDQFNIAGYLASKKPALPVFEAAALGENEQLRKALDADKSQVNAVNADGFQPLGLACHFRRAEAARILLEHGADVNSPSQNTQCITPLQSAASGRSLEITRLLLEHGALVDAVQRGGYTALHAAVQNEHLEMVELLLAYGADADKANESGFSARDLARRSKNKALKTMMGLPPE